MVSLRSFFIGIGALCLLVGIAGFSLFFPDHVRSRRDSQNGIPLDYPQDAVAAAVPASQATTFISARGHGPIDTAARHEDINQLSSNRLLSVILPVYNGMDGLPQALDSLLKQRSCGFEFDIICVDDGSSDGSYAYLRRMAKKHKHITVVQHAQNAGLPAALNTGHTVVRTPWVTWTSYDNVQYDDFVCSLSRAASMYPEVGFITAAFEGRNEVDEHKPAVKVPATVTTFSPPHRGLFQWRGCAAFAYSLEAYNAAGGYDGTFKLCEDYEFWIKILKFSPASVSLLKPIYLYVWQKNSLTSTKHKQAVHCVNKLLHKYLTDGPSGEMNVYHMFPVARMCAKRKTCAAVASAYLVRFATEASFNFNKLSEQPYLCRQVAFSYKSMPQDVTMVDVLYNHAICLIANGEMHAAAVLLRQAIETLQDTTVTAEPNSLGSDLDSSPETRGVSMDRSLPSRIRTLLSRVKNDNSSQPFTFSGKIVREMVLRPQYFHQLAGGVQPDHATVTGQVELLYKEALWMSVYGAKSETTLPGSGQGPVIPSLDCVIVVLTASETSAAYSLRLIPPKALNVFCASVHVISTAPIAGDSYIHIHVSSSSMAVSAIQQLQPAVVLALDLSVSCEAAMAAMQNRHNPVVCYAMHATVVAPATDYLKLVSFVFAISSSTAQSALQAGCTQRQVWRIPFAGDQPEQEPDGLPPSCIWRWHAQLLRLALF
jgi:Glycosyl transferase family 2